MGLLHRIHPELADANPCQGNTGHCSPSALTAYRSIAWSAPKSLCESCATVLMALGCDIEPDRRSEARPFVAPWRARLTARENRDAA